MKAVAPVGARLTHGLRAYTSLAKDRRHLWHIGYPKLVVEYHFS